MVIVVGEPEPAALVRRHSRWVRVSHWVSTLSVLTLAVTGYLILMVHQSMNYVRRVVVADELDDGGKNGNIQNGWAWYTGI